MNFYGTTTLEIRKFHGLEKVIKTSQFLQSTPTAKPKRTLKQIEMEREECNPEDINNEEKEDYSPPKEKSKSEVLLYFSLCYSVSPHSKL